MMDVCRANDLSLCFEYVDNVLTQSSFSAYSKLSCSKRTVRPHNRF